MNRIPFDSIRSATSIPPKYVVTVAITAQIIVHVNTPKKVLLQVFSVNKFANVSKPTQSTNDFGGI
ncbi:hypothetical protein D3C71_1997510 [compost metagenome]